jgi:octaheme c-type cytochrome (tetrathionate reductase family)
VVCATAAALTLLTGCPLPPSNGGDGNEPNTPPKTLHEQVFTEIVPGGFQSTQDCLFCHSTEARDLAQRAHWLWQGPASGIVGHETEQHGKRDLIDSFFIGVPSNEGRCSQCHPSFGYKDKSFDFTDTSRVDCLVCHDTTGTYAKHPTANGGGGAASLLVNGAPVVVTDPNQLLNVVYHLGKPTRANCGACHFYACGGDNVKDGTLSSALLHPTQDQDFHMGGLDFDCQTCHTFAQHGFAGMTSHSTTEGGASPTCTRCHGVGDFHNRFPGLDELLNLHLDHVACEACHIPTFARTVPTNVGWFWDEAGQDIDPVPTDQFGLPTFDKLKGRLVWGKSIRPTYLWYDGRWERRIVGADDTYTAAGSEGDPVVLARPVATASTPGAKVYPFKKMIGRQPADTTNRRLIVPHLFGTAAGPNAYWDKFDWAAALGEGAAYSGVPYSGNFGFVNTVMYLRVSHEVAPASQALRCNNCHGDAALFAGLGIPDPLARP